MQVGQVMLVKEKVGQIPPEKWIIVRASKHSNALALFNRKDYRPIGCLSDEEIEIGIEECKIEMLDIFKIKKSKKKKVM